jgi:hypothetical protein
MREDKQLIVLTHLSQLLSFITGFGGLIVPLIIWVTQKETVFQMDEQGKRIINFQISMLIYCIVCIPFIFILIGIPALILLGLLSLILPIVNAVKASNGELPTYPLTISFLK